MLQNAFAEACGSKEPMATDVIELLLNCIDPTHLINQKFRGAPVTPAIVDGPLIVACWRGSPETIRMLLNDSRVNPNYEHKRRLNAFHIICLQGYTDIVEQMLANTGIDIDAFSGGFSNMHFQCTSAYTGRNPTIRSALFSGNVELIKLLCVHERTTDFFDFKTCVRNNFHLITILIDCCMCRERL